MRKLIAIVFLVLMAGCQKKSNEVYYFIYGDHLTKNESEQYITYYYRYRFFYDEYHDTISNEYVLIHKNKEDTFFLKPASFLDSIDVFDKNWFKSDEKLNHILWDVPWRIEQDSLIIFMGEKNLQGDTIIFRRVHRFKIGYL